MNATYFGIKISFIFVLLVVGTSTFIQSMCEKFLVPQYSLTELVDQKKINPEDIIVRTKINSLPVVQLRVANQKDPKITHYANNNSCLAQSFKNTLYTLDMLTQPAEKIPSLLERLKSYDLINITFPIWLDFIEQHFYIKNPSFGFCSDPIINALRDGFKTTFKPTINDSIKNNKETESFALFNPCIADYIASGGYFDKDADSSIEEITKTINSIENNSLSVDEAHALGSALETLHTIFAMHNKSSYEIIRWIQQLQAAASSTFGLFIKVSGHSFSLTIAKYQHKLEFIVSDSYNNNPFNKSDNPWGAENYKNALDTWHTIISQNPAELLLRHAFYEFNSLFNGFTDSSVSHSFSKKVNGEWINFSKQEAIIEDLEKLITEFTALNVFSLNIYKKYYSKVFFDRVDQVIQIIATKHFGVKTSQQQKLQVLETIKEKLQCK